MLALRSVRAAARTSANAHATAATAAAGAGRPRRRRVDRSWSRDICERILSSLVVVWGETSIAIRGGGFSAYFEYLTGNLPVKGLLYYFLKSTVSAASPPALCAQQRTAWLVRTRGRPRGEAARCERTNPIPNKTKDIPFVLVQRGSRLRKCIVSDRIRHIFLLPWRTGCS